MKEKGVAEDITELKLFLGGGGGVEDARGMVREARGQ